MNESKPPSPSSRREDPSDTPVEPIAAGNWLALRRRGPWEFATRVRGRCAAVILAETDDGEVVLIEQYRPALGRRCLELPAGLVGDTAEAPDEDVLVAAGRELVEETGYRADALERVAQGPASAGLSDEELILVRARGLRRVGAGGGDEHEDIEVHLVAREKLHDFIGQKSRAGVAIDLKIWAGLYWLSAAAP